MSSPLDLKEFKHYLDFKNDEIGRIQITEPVKFDGAEFVISQDDKGYARDISYMSEEMDLEFYKGFWEQSDLPYQLPNGLIVDKLGHAIEYLFKYNKDFGFQSQIEYVLERNGIEFILGELNFEGCKTDELTYFYCKVVQNTKRALSKRREDTKIDGFATEDLDGNPITPLQTENLLLKAKPITQENKWENNVFACVTSNGNPPSSRVNQNSIFNTTKYQIEKSLGGGLYKYIDNGDINFYNDIYDNFVYIETEDDLSELTINIENLSIDYYNTAENESQLESLWTTRTGNPDPTFSIEMHLYVMPVDVEYPFDSGSGYQNLDHILISDSFIIYPKNYENLGSQPIGSYIGELPDGQSDTNGYRWKFSFNDLEHSIPFIPRGYRLCMFFNLGCQRSVARWMNGNVNMITTATAIDTVIKAVRYGDLLRHSLKAINQMDILAPELDEGGKYYDLFAFSGNFIRQRVDVPFYFDFKDRRENFQALANGDVQINEDDAFALPYNKFYDNVDNGGFLTIPNDAFEMTYNQRYSVNLLEYKFKNYEKDRNESNTLDAVHTEAQFSINNTRVKNTKKIDISDVFDVFSIESQRSQVYKETTALDGDDKIHCIDVVNLSPTARGGFIAPMRHNIDDNGRLKLLKDANLPSWGLLGFGVGSEFEIESDKNNGIYYVYEIDNTVITLTPDTGVVPNYNGAVSTKVSYPFSDVQYTNRTDEGFDVIENVLNPTNFGNLRYTIRRNLVEYEPYLSTCASFIEEDIKNTEFKNNGLLVTQFEGGTTYTENAPIVLNEITPAILSPRAYTIDVVAGYDDVLGLVRKYQDIETVGGFIRVQGNNGDIKRIYPKKLGYTWATEVLSIEGEERVEKDVVIINRVGDIIYVNEVGYNEDEISETFYEANGEYFTLYDANHIKIINFTKYNKFIVQEETFDNTNGLAQALIDL